MREARPHMEALANRFLKMPTEMLLPPGYSNIESMKRIRAAKITGKPQTLDDLVRNGVVIVGSPNTVREKLAEYQDLAGFNTSLTKTQFGTLPDDHDARQHDGDRAGDSAALPRPPAAGQAAGRGGVEIATSFRDALQRERCIQTRGPEFCIRIPGPRSFAPPRNDARGA